MNAANSDLVLLDFSIIESQVTTLFPKELNQKVVAEAKPVKIDYTVQEKTAEEGDGNRFFRIFITISSNREDPQPGYIFLVKAVAFFKIQAEIEENKVQQYILYSGLPLMISSIRAFIAQVTGQGPFGRYQFPSIDLDSVIKNSQNNPE